MSDLVDVAVRVLRDETAVEVDGAMTRQRIEAGWLQHRARGRAIRRMTTVAAVALVVGGGAWAATTLILRVRTAIPILPPARTPRPEGRPTRPVVAPSGTVACAASTESASPPIATRPAGNLGRSADAATSAYEAAHRAHFLDRDWPRSLDLWTRYLRLAPQGQLAPEAHFNRAICLIHLDRLDEATAALQPFAIGLLGTYRQREARQLLDTITVPAR